MRFSAFTFPTLGVLLAAATSTTTADAQPAPQPVPVPQPAPTVAPPTAPPAAPSAPTTQPPAPTDDDRRPPVAPQPTGTPQPPAVPQPGYNRPYPQPGYNQPYPQPGYNQPRPQPGYNQPRPPPGYNQPYPQPGYNQPYPQQYPQPGYDPRGPQPGYGAGTGYGPPPPNGPIEEDDTGCCNWSARVDPFDLLFRRATLEFELAWGDLPLTAEASASWIFDSPSDGLSESGVDLAARIGWYVGGEPLKGFYIKANLGYETFNATLERDVGDGTFLGVPNAALCDSDSAPGTCSKQVSSTVLGLLVGNSAVFGADGGFSISGSIGIGVALADTVELQVDPCTPADVQSGVCSGFEGPNASSLRTTYYDASARIRLLGSLGLGVTF